MWFNYVLLYTLYVNEGIFFLLPFFCCCFFGLTYSNSIRERLADGWVGCRSGRWEGHSRQY